MMATVYRPRFTRGALARMFCERGYRKGAEIGTRQGAYAWNLCASIPGLHLLCVDPWENYQTTPKHPHRNHAANYTTARERLSGFNVVFVKATSMVAVRTVPMASLDFVYIDGHHGYEFVRDDLREWSARVKPGGVVAGDDFDAPGVQQALGERAEPIWLCDDRGRRTQSGERMRSWWLERT